MTTDILDLIDNALLDATSVDAMRWTPDAERVADEPDRPRLDEGRLYWTPNADVPGGAVPGEWHFSGHVTQVEDPQGTASLVLYRVERPDGNLLYTVTTSSQFPLIPHRHDRTTGALHICGHVINPPWVMRVIFRVWDDLMRRGGSHWEGWMVTDDQGRMVTDGRAEYTLFPR